MKVENNKETRAIKKVAASMAIEEKYVDEEFANDLLKVSRGKKTYQELRERVIKNIPDRTSLLQTPKKIKSKKENGTMAKKKTFEQAEFEFFTDFFKKIGDFAKEVKDDVRHVVRGQGRYVVIRDLTEYLNEGYNEKWYLINEENPELVYEPKSDELKEMVAQLKEYGFKKYFEPEVDVYGDEDITCEFVDASLLTFEKICDTFGCEKSKISLDGKLAYYHTQIFNPIRNIWGPAIINGEPAYIASDDVPPEDYAAALIALVESGKPQRETFTVEFEEEDE